MEKFWWSSSMAWKINVKSFKLHLDSSVYSLLRGRRWACSRPFPISYFHAPLQPHVTVSICVTTANRKIQEKWAGPTASAPLRFQQPVSNPRPTPDLGHTDQTSFGQLGDRERQEMGPAVWNKVEKEKTSCILGWCMKRQQWACPLTQIQILNEVVACKCNLTSKAGLLSQDGNTF